MIDLYPFQREVVDWAVERPGAAIFCEQGVGKTYIACGVIEQLKRRRGATRGKPPSAAQRADLVRREVGDETTSEAAKSATTKGLAPLRTPVRSETRATTPSLPRGKRTR